MDRGGNRKYCDPYYTLQLIKIWMSNGEACMYKPGAIAF